MTTYNLQLNIIKTFLCILTFSCLGNIKANAQDGAPSITQVIDTTIYVKPDKEPAFKGGADALLTFINKNLQYPPLMLRNEIEGKVIVQFIVETDGKLSNVKALRGPGRGSLEEAVRIVKLLPK